MDAQALENEIERLRQALDEADAIVVGAGAGLSTAAGFTYAGDKVLHLELGVGGNTPVIIKYPFWRFTNENPNAIYACVNLGETWTPSEIRDRSILVDGDIDEVLNVLLREKE